MCDRGGDKPRAGLHVDTLGAQPGGNGHEYALIRTITEFSQADAIAVAEGGHLATISSQAENDWIVSKFNNPPTDNYIMVA